MSLRYLPEHAERARQALDLAEREARHLGYTARTLFAEARDLAWVEDAEAFVGARKLRNLPVHESMTDALVFLDALRSAEAGTAMLLELVSRLRAFAEEVELPAG